MKIPAKIYVTFQQSELDAVKMYGELAKLAADDDEKRKLFELGVVEALHAAVLKIITGRNDLRPSDSMAAPVLAVRKVLGRRVTYTLMAAGEYGASWLYKPLAREHESLVTVGKQEAEHALELLKLVKRSLPAPVTGLLGAIRTKAEN